MTGLWTSVTTANRRCLQASAVALDTRGQLKSSSCWCCRCSLIYRGQKLSRPPPTPPTEMWRLFEKFEPRNMTNDNYGQRQNMSDLLDNPFKSHPQSQNTPKLSDGQWTTAGHIWFEMKIKETNTRWEAQFSTATLGSLRNKWLITVTTNTQRDVPTHNKPQTDTDTRT